MIFTESAKSKFWEDLSTGIKTTFNHSIGDAFHMDQYKSGRFTFTESVVGGPGSVTLIMDKIKESSKAIKSVRMTPISNGYNATYNVSVDFDPMVAESVYSNGKSALASISANGKNYIVHNDGSATEVDDADKYVANLNKTTGANFKKEEDFGSRDVNCTVRFKDDGTEMDVVIRIDPAYDCDTLHSDDDSIFYYCESQEEFNKLKDENNGEDFVIVSVDEKYEGLTDEDGMPIDLGTVVDLANKALEDTGVTVVMEDDRLVLRGVAELIKPTQEYLPTPYYGSDVIEGGYNDETGDMEVCIPEYISECELEQLRSFLIGAVNCIIDAVECQNSDTCEDDEWVEAMATAEPDDSYASQYAYKGESFVGTDKAKVTTLVKSLMAENYGEAVKVATKFMGQELAEGLVRKYAPEKVSEKHEVIMTDEMELLDSIHESAMARAPEKSVSMESLVEKNMYNKENI